MCRLVIILCIKSRLSPSVVPGADGRLGQRETIENPGELSHFISFQRVFIPGVLTFNPSLCRCPKRGEQQHHLDTFKNSENKPNKNMKPTAVEERRNKQESTPEESSLHLPAPRGARLMLLMMRMARLTYRVTLASYFISKRRLRCDSLMHSSLK